MNIDDRSRENQKHIRDIDARLRRVDRYIDSARKKEEEMRTQPGHILPPRPATGEAGHLTP